MSGLDLRSLPQFQWDEKQKLNSSITRICMQEWTYELIANAQQGLIGMVKEGENKYGTDDREC